MRSRQQAKRILVAAFGRCTRGLQRLQARLVPSSGRAFYLVSAAGLPNYGDEFITRAWLRYLAAEHPDVDVWLDCLEPGRAAFLFGDVHPRLRTTNTLWQLTTLIGDGDPVEVGRTAERLVRDLGTPRLDPGLEAIRTMRSVHLLGGGYINRIWQNNLGLIHALVAVKRIFGIPIYATGQGLLPQNHDSAEVLRRVLPEFDFVESRDSAGAQLLGIPLGLDDAFLGVTRGDVFDADESSPEVMILIQGDMIPDGHIDDLLDAAEQFVAGVGGDRQNPIGFVEAIPPDDSRFYGLVRGRFPQSRFYPFSHLWNHGLPVRPGQHWLTTRFHIHLLAAAGGANGAFITGRAGYYDIKHESLVELRTGWSNAGSTEAIDESGLHATGTGRFAARAIECAAAKAAIAARLYPAAPQAG